MLVGAEAKASCANARCFNRSKLIKSRNKRIPVSFLESNPRHPEQIVKLDSYWKSDHAHSAITTYRKLSGSFGNSTDLSSNRRGNDQHVHLMETGAI